MADDEPTEGWPEERFVELVGCTCPHDFNDHGWSGCKVDGCMCAGAWDE
jgi:hypothetical protein